MPLSDPEREELQHLLDDPLLRDAPIVEGFKVLDPAVLYAKIGRGGMGAVYRGRHFKLDLDVAVKCLKPSLVAEDADFVKRFEREARLAASIAHQNVVRVMDVHEKNGIHYLVMEFVRGETAAERVERKGRLTEREALAILYGATAGLAEAHARGIVHRDIKPSNLMVSVEGRVKLADLGFAKSSRSVDGRSMAKITSAIMGTPQYMPPEQWDTTDVTAAADVWALGATMWFLLAGREGIAGGSPVQIGKQIKEHDFPSLRGERRDVREAVHELIERCVRRDPRERYPDAKALLRDLRRLVGDDEEEVLLDPEAGRGKKQFGTVTPPPRETLLRIRTQIDTNTGQKRTPTVQESSAALTAFRGNENAASFASPAAETEPRVASGESAGASRARASTGLRGGSTKWALAAVLLAGVFGASYVMGAFSSAPPASPASGSRAEAQALHAAGLQKLPRPGQVDAAIADFEKALSLDPGLDDARVQLAIAFEVKATKALEADDPDAAFVYAGRGLSWRSGDLRLQARRLEASTALATRLTNKLVIREPQADVILGTREFGVVGQVKTTSCRSLRIVVAPAETPASAVAEAAVGAAAGDFSARVTVPSDGRFVVRLEATDRHGIAATSPGLPFVVDSEAPQLTVTSPEPSEKVGANFVVRGRVVDLTPCRVTIDGEPAEVVGSEWSRAMTLREGQEIVVEAMDAGGLGARIGQAFAVDATPPELELEAIPAITNQTSLPLRGTVKGLDGGLITLGGTPLQPAADGRIAMVLPLPKDAVFATVVVVIDDVGNRAEYPIRIRQCTVPPVLEWSGPDPAKPVAPGRVEISGRVRSTLELPRVTVNGEPATLDFDRWRAQVAVRSDEEVEIVVEATDRAGNKTSLHRTLHAQLVFSDRVAADFENISASTEADRLPQRIVHRETKIPFVLVAARTFWMGSLPSESGRSEDETYHAVTICHPFYMGETEVTQKQWRAVMGTEPWKGQKGTLVGDNVAATFVSWTDAVAFCRSLTDRARAAGRLPGGYEYRLPTEAEWEMACRGGSTTAFCFGNDQEQLQQFAVIARSRDGDFAHVVRSARKPNNFGLYDMHGNVWEWCADKAEYVDALVVTDTYRDVVADPLCVLGSLRVNRGGSWSGGPTGCRSAFRVCGAPDRAVNDLGFRPVLAARPSNR